MTRLPILAVLAAAGALPARADDCATIHGVFEALAGVPAYSQQILMAGDTPAETVAVGETLYVRADGEWSKLELGPGGRLAAMRMAIPDAASLKDCSVVGDEVVEGVETTVYRYLPPDMGGMAQGPQKLWVGADGLPVKMESEDGTTVVTIAYSGVTAPIP